MYSSNGTFGLRVYFSNCALKKFPHECCLLIISKKSVALNFHVKFKTIIYFIQNLIFSK